MVAATAAAGSDTDNAFIRNVEVEMPDSTSEPWQSVEILGRAELSIDRMYAFIKKRNPNFSYEVAEAFYNIGERYGVRGDIAICQAVLETGWFRFLDGTLVRSEQYNFGGLGVTKAGESGNSFVTLEEGVTAMIQHLYAYACADEIPSGEQIVDKRFGLVNRGCAPTWHQLSNRWAMNPDYGRSIMRIYSGMERFQLPPRPEQEVLPESPELPEVLSEHFR